MRDAALKLLPEATAVIKTAAVSDYRPKAAAAQKIKRKGPMTLELEATPGHSEKELSLKKSLQIIMASPPKRKSPLKRTPETHAKEPRRHRRQRRFL